jgi:hypothetical protein
MDRIETMKQEMDDYYKSIDKTETDIEFFYARYPETHECWKYSKAELQSFIVAWKTLRGEADWRYSHELAQIIVNHEAPSKRGLILPFVNRGRLDAVDMNHVTIEGIQAIAHRTQSVLMESGMDEEDAARLAHHIASRIVGKE